MTERTGSTPRTHRPLPSRGHTVALFAVTLVAACRPGEIPRSMPPASPLPAGGRAPDVRVGIAVDTSEVTVSAATPFEIVPAGGGESLSSEADRTWTFAARAGRITAGSGDRRRVAATAITVRARGGRIRIGQTDYRGDATLIASANGITAINVVDLEDYLLGVVAREIGNRPRTEIEAVKAQAIAARTYAIGNRGGRSGLGFDYFAGTLDQVYGGLPAEDSIASLAVRETRGEIVTYRGLPILAYYSSTCGGRTAAIEESWPWRAPLPYLKSVSDRIPGTDDYYCSMSNRFRWSTTWTRAQLLETLGATLRSYVATARVPVNRVRDVRIEDTSESGRASVRIDVDGTNLVLRADSVRWILRTPAGGLLNSSRIESIDATRAADGAVDSLTIHGGGWGHGIGMCQIGAVGRARAGQRYDTILRTYYPGTAITRLY
jgi:stage II sporulation protein D (peptidoglycan lytic transglycosylase)